MRSKRLSRKAQIGKPLLVACISIPIILVITAFIASWIANNHGLPTPDCTLSGPYIVFGVIPSDLGFFAALPGLVLFIRRKNIRLVLIQVLVILVTIIVGLIANFALTWCM